MTADPQPAWPAASKPVALQRDPAYGTPSEVRADDTLTDRPVVPLRHPWRWVATVVVLILVAQLIHGLISNPFYQWDRFHYWFLRSSSAAWW